MDAFTKHTNYLHICDDDNNNNQENETYAI